jgi:formylglycine-generating enzyme required for sulfatase activity
MRGKVAAIGLAILTFCAAQMARADDQMDWLMMRQAEFIRFQTAHPNQDAAIADLKTKTAALVAAAGAPVTDVSAPPAARRVPGAITEIWDNPVAPQMMVVPAGSYTMGSPPSEQGRFANEIQHRVTINYAFAVGKYPVTRDEYAAFIAETNRPDGATCYAPLDTGFWLAPGWSQAPAVTWHSPSFPQSGRDPVVCVSWNDAQAYAAWLSKKTGMNYRLLSEAEWEYVARAGTTTARYWGEAANHEYGNYGAEAAAPAQYAGLTSGVDRWLNTAPVGSFPPNAFGVYDMLGNVWQWVQDCYQPGYAAPADGSALECNTRFPRGGGWNSPSNLLRAAYHNTATTPVRSTVVGFRVARSL